MDPPINIYPGIFGAPFGEKKYKSSENFSSRHLPDLFGSVNQASAMSHIIYHTHASIDCKLCHSRFIKCPRWLDIFVAFFESTCIPYNYSVIHVSKNIKLIYVLLLCTVGSLCSVDEDCYEGLTCSMYATSGVGVCIMPGTGELITTMFNYFHKSTTKVYITIRMIICCVVHIGCCC